MIFPTDNFLLKSQEYNSCTKKITAWNLLTRSSTMHCKTSMDYQKLVILYSVNSKRLTNLIKVHKYDIHVCGVADVCPQWNNQHYSNMEEDQYAGAALKQRCTILGTNWHRFDKIPSQASLCEYWILAKNLFNDKNSNMQKQ